MLNRHCAYWGHDLDLWGSRDVIGHNRSRDHLISRHSFPIGALLLPSRYLQPFSRYWPLSVLGSRPWPSRVTWRHRSRDH